VPISATMYVSQIDVYAGPAWVSSALIASSLDPTPMRGDSLAALLFEASRQVGFWSLGDGLGLRARGGEGNDEV
jgi:hypothetical protein